MDKSTIGARTAGKTVDIFNAAGADHVTHYRREEWGGMKHVTQWYQHNADGTVTTIPNASPLRYRLENAYRDRYTPEAT